MHNTNDAANFIFASFTGIAGGAAGAAGAAVSIGDGKTAIPLLIVAGVCGMVGALFFNAQEDERAAFDFTLLAAAFIAGSAAGPAIGVSAFSLIPNVDQSYIAEFGPHMLGGLIAGGCLVLVFRLLWARLRQRSRDKGKGDQK